MPIKRSKCDRFGGELCYQLKLLVQSYVQGQACLATLCSRVVILPLPFHFADSRLLMCDSFMSHLRYVLAGPGFLYAGHCFGAEAATAAALRGL